jgi:hypothetical protein
MTIVTVSTITYFQKGIARPIKQRKRYDQKGKALT